MELTLVDTKQQKIRVGIVLYPLVIKINSTVASFSPCLTGKDDDDDYDEQPEQVNFLESQFLWSLRLVLQ